MIKAYFDVEGMMCSMCEAHINDVVRKNVDISKIKSKHRKKLTIVTLENKNDIDKIIESIESLGYGCKLNKIEEI